MELTYTLENPTNYFLTFGVLMETNDEFAFSGPKQMNIALLPVSKAAIEYRLLPYARERWVRPNLKVVDRYFNKTLKTAPGGEGVAVDKTGLMVWVPEDLEVEEEVKEEVKEVKEVKEVVVEEVIGSDENTRDDKLTDIAAGKEEETKEEVEGEDDDDDEDDSDYVDESSSDDDPEEYEEDSEEDSGPGEDQEPVATAAATTTV